MSKYYITIFIVCLFFGCKTPVKQVIKNAGDNGSELQSVLDHFVADTSKEKLLAAKFIIENLPGHYSNDTSNLTAYRPFINQVCSLKIVCGTDKELFRKKINDAWTEYNNKNQFNISSSDYYFDYNIIDDNYLINDIELAYHTWKTNPYSSDVNFNDFCEYILPYKRAKGLPIENWREHFSSITPKGILSNDSLSIKAYCDSLLFLYKDFNLDYIIPKKIPILKVEDFESTKNGLCSQKAWLNNMLLASHGIACATDFVPAWGNRAERHSWNVVLHNDTSFAYDPFWEEERWKNKYLYNNLTYDGYWGEFRLPKVYRYTYSAHIEGPITDNRVELSNVPGVFKDVHKIDVSHEYFSSQDVEINITNKIPDDTYYCYLCVFGLWGWRPVQWGEIKNNKVVFKQMGKDIIYLPCFYKSDEYIPAANPILLKTDGSVLKLEPDLENTEQVVANKFRPQYPFVGDGIKKISGSKIEAADNLKFDLPEHIYTLPDTMLYGINIHYLDHPVNERFMRIVFPPNSGELLELQFYTKNKKGDLVKVSGNVCCSDSLSMQNVSKAFDSVNATGFVYDVNKGEQKWIGLDFGQKTEIDAIGFSPGVNPSFISGYEYELFYWNDGWVSVGAKLGEGEILTYENVPENALLMLTKTRLNPRKLIKKHRVFLYQNGEQVWF